MLQNNYVVVLIAFVYLGFMFAIAFYADKRADEGRSITNNPWIYSLSIAVYCTVWTFYGSVGRAAASGFEFLAVYIGPTLMAILWWLVLRKIIRICKIHRITTIAGFISSRYGKSFALSWLVTIITVIGIMPYISLQLKGVSTSINIILQYPDIITKPQTVSIWYDTAFYVALIMATFTIIFGARNLDAFERHEGMVAAVAFESTVELLAFLAVGLFVVFGMYNGIGDIFEKAHAIPEIDKLFTVEENGYTNWFTIIILSMMAIMFLPRQFQMMVVENIDEKHIKHASWSFPLYMLLINAFVLPIAFGGLLRFPDGSVSPDTFVLALPMVEKQEMLTMVVFLGGLSAATSMIAVTTVSISTMVSNDLLLPILMRMRFLQLDKRSDLSGLILREDIEFKTSLADGEIIIYADTGRIEQVLINLVTNARDAMENGGTFSIDTSIVELDKDYIKKYNYGKPGEYAFISISDTGSGMDRDISKRIFEPFFTTKKPGRGTGLGLSIVYGIIRQHDGYINVYSEPGIGTTFKIYLPVIKSGVVIEKTEDQVELDVVYSGNETVLIAEDEETVRDITGDILKEFGYNVIFAKDGLEAVSIFMDNKKSIDLLIFDLIMPKKNGREAYEEINKIKPGIKILFISGYTADLIHEKGIIDEGLDLIVKPVSINNLLKKVREKLDS